MLNIIGWQIMSSIALLSRGEKSLCQQTAGVDESMCKVVGLEDSTTGKMYIGKTVILLQRISQLQLQINTIEV